MNQRITEEAERLGVSYEALLERILYYGWEVYREVTASDDETGTP